MPRPEKQPSKTSKCSCCGAAGRRVTGCSCQGGKSHTCLKENPTTDKKEDPRFTAHKSKVVTVFANLAEDESKNIRSWAHLTRSVVAKDHKRGLIQSLKIFLQESKNVDEETEWIRTTDEEEQMLNAMEEELL